MKRRAFTLIELLVVIAIIAVLMGILMPGLQAAREHAKRIQCTSNAKSMVQGWLMYADDFDGRLVNSMVESLEDAEEDGRTHPWVVTPSGWSDDDLDAAIENGALYPYVGKSVGVYRCPSDTRYRMPSLRPFRSFSIADGANGEDWLKNEYTPSRKITDIKRPSEKYIFVEDISDAEYVKGSWCLGFSSPRWIDPLAVWHKRKSTMAYADGHAGSYAWRDQNFLDWSQEVLEAVMTDNGAPDAPDLVEGERQDYDYMAENYPCKIHKDYH